MKTTMYTEGPWVLKGFEIEGRYGNFVATVRPGSIGWDNDAENARLISAAPMLLEVLEAIVRTADGRTISGNLILDKNSPLIGAARDAIKVATQPPPSGQTIPLCPHGRISGRRCDDCPGESATAIVEGRA